MPDKTKELARLLKHYRQTGDEDYLQAAGCLKVSLLDDLMLRSEIFRPKHRGKTVGKEVRPRLYRMAHMVAGGARIYAAARREVEKHGRGAHASEEAAIKYLRDKYREHRAEIEATIAEIVKINARWRSLARQVEATNRMMQGSATTQAMQRAWLASTNALSRPVDLSIERLRAHQLVVEKQWRSLERLGAAAEVAVGGGLEKYLSKIDREKIQ
jgi:hypothetical protein